MDNGKVKKGWHLVCNSAPHKDKNITVSGLRTKKDVDKIKECLNDRPRDFALFVVGINSGLRGNDLLKLKYRDILTSDGRIGNSVSIREGKTKKLREFVIGKNIQKALFNLLPKNGDGVNLDDCIFSSRKGGKMSIQRLHQLINEWAKEAGIKGHFGSHTLRKTFAYFLLKKGADIHLLMKTLNHSSPAVTLRYAGVEKEDIDNAILRLNL